MKGVERMNIVMVNLNQRAGFVQCNPYAMDVDCRNRNCYNYGGFRYLTRNCRNRETENRTGEERRLEYRNRRMIEEGNENSSNLNENKNLIVLN